MLAPILVFTAEEIWQHLPKDKQDQSVNSVHLLAWPVKNPLFAQEDLVKRNKDIDTELKVIIELIPQVAKILEEKRNQGDIGSSFDAEIILLTNDEIRYKYLMSLKDGLSEIFKVSRVSIEKKDELDQGAISEKYPEVAVLVKKAQGKKCVRCWNYSFSVGESGQHPLLCEKCIGAL
jgi:isoleucyl-tRNA synthetase